MGDKISEELRLSYLAAMYRYQRSQQEVRALKAEIALAEANLERASREKIDALRAYQDAEKRIREDHQLAPVDSFSLEDGTVLRRATG